MADTLPDESDAAESLRRAIRAGRPASDPREESRGDDLPFIPLDRELWESDVVRTMTAMQRLVVVELYALANWKAAPWYFRGKPAGLVERGELAHAYRTIAARVGVGCTKDVVEGVVRRLQSSRHLIVKMPTQHPTLGRVLRLVNYRRKTADSPAQPTLAPTLGSETADTRGSREKKREQKTDASSPPAAEERRRAVRQESGTKASNSAADAPIFLFARLWRELRGGKYRPSWARDRKAARQLLSYEEATEAEQEARMRRALDDDFFRATGHFAAFVVRWSNWDGACSLRVLRRPPARRVTADVGDWSSPDAFDFGDRRKSRAA